MSGTWCLRRVISHGHATKCQGRRKEMMFQKMMTFVDEDEPPASGEWAAKENGDDLSSIAEDASKIQH